MSWARKVLRVDLGKGTCSAEPLNMEWAAQYLGQRGLATDTSPRKSIPRSIRCRPPTR